MKISIKNTKDMKIDSVKTVVYGYAGSGKTRLAASSPNPLMISAESGLLSVAGDSVDYIEVRSLKEFEDCYRFVATSSDSDKYDTVCLDSLSEIAEVLIAKILPNHTHGMQAYGELAEKMMPVIKNFKHLKGKHTVFTVKARLVEDEETGRITDEIFMPGKKVASLLPYEVDELFFIGENKKKVTKVFTKASRRTFCKDRSGALLDEEAPDMTAIIEKIMKKVGR